MADPEVMDLLFLASNEAVWTFCTYFWTALTVLARYLLFILALTVSEILFMSSTLSTCLMMRLDRSLRVPGLTF